MGFNWWVNEAFAAGGFVAVGTIVFWVLFSITMHELAHGWSAIREGDDTPIVTGHMTWNPLVHMGTLSLVMFAILGFCWGAMPVNPSRFRSRHGEAIVAGAGPAMNLGLAVISAILLVLWERFAAAHAPPHVRNNVELFLRMGVGTNLFLMLFNLIPVPPLDGSKIVGDFWPRYWRILSSERAAFVAVVAILLVFQGAGTSVMRAGHVLGQWMIEGLRSVLG